jgi:hypothetical protein
VRALNAHFLPFDYPTWKDGSPEEALPMSTLWAVILFSHYQNTLEVVCLIHK